MKLLNKLALPIVLLTSFCMCGCDSNEPIEKELLVTDIKASNYKIGEIFSDFVNDGGMVVSVVYSDDSVKQLDKNGYKYKIYNFEDEIIDANKPFTAVGQYKVVVHRDNLNTVNHNILVKEKDGPGPVVKKTLKEIKATNYTTEAAINSSYVFDGKVTAYYSDGSSLDVTKLCTIVNPSTLVVGTSQGSISYTEKNITKTIYFNIDVK